MKTWILLPLSIAVAVPTSLFLRTEARAAAESERLAHFADRADELARSLASLERQRAQLERSAAELQGLAAPAARPFAKPHGATEEEIAAAVSRALAARLALAAASDSAVASSIDELDMESILAYMDEPGRTRSEVELVFAQLFKAGRLDEYVAAVEARAQAAPENTEFALAAADAYLQQMFAKAGTPEALEWAEKTDEACDRVLALDEQNWAARFVKAISLSNWPDFLGRRGEAIAEFELLRAQQEAGPAHPGHARTYLFLGSLYERSGDKQKALEIWEAGLALFPRNAELLERLEIARN